MVNYVFSAADRGLISLEPWIHQDVARPTGLIIRVVIVVVTLFYCPVDSRHGKHS